MTKTFGEDMIEALEEVLAIANGERLPARVHTYYFPDVRAIRKKVGMSQQQFAATYRIPLPTLKGWEQGRRHPDATAAAYLTVIANMPREAQQALGA